MPLSSSWEFLSSIITLRRLYSALSLKVLSGNIDKPWNSCSYVNVFSFSLISLFRNNCFWYSYLNWMFSGWGWVLLLLMWKVLVTLKSLIFSAEASSDILVMSSSSSLSDSGRPKITIFLLHFCEWWKSSLNSLICLLTYSLTADMKSALLSKDILLSSCSTLYSKWLKFAFRLSNSSSIFLFMLVRNLEVSIVLQSWLLYDTWGSFLRTLCSSNWPMHSGCAPLSQLGHIVKFSCSSC